jgi:hypothetical protein
MTKIQIICSSPGMRRNGIEHPASAFYEDGHWTEKQLAAFRADPAFVVREVDETTENTVTDVDVQLRVDSEVKRLLAIKSDELQTSFQDAVNDAVIEKTATLKGEHDTALDAIGKKLAAAETSVADLTAKLAAATKATAPKK